MISRSCLGKTGVTADRDKIEFRLFNSSSIFNITLREESFSLPKKTQTMHSYPGFMALVTWVKFLGEKLKATIPLVMSPRYISLQNATAQVSWLTHPKWCKKSRVPHTRGPLAYNGTLNLWLAIPATNRSGVRRLQTTLHAKRARPNPISLTTCRSR